MSEITTIGLDLAKHVFQVHGIDAEGTTVLGKRLRRGQCNFAFRRRRHSTPWLSFDAALIHGLTVISIP